MTSLPSLFRQSVAVHGDLPCYWSRESHELVSTSYTVAAEQVEAAAAGLLADGVAAGEKVVVMAENRPEWLLADLAILSCGAVTVPIYPSLPPAQVQPQAAKVKVRVAIVEDAGQLAKLDACRDQLPELERIYVMEPRKVAEDHPLARSWDHLLAAGRERLAESRAELDDRIAALTLDDVATIIFTSGTTGIPKGAMLTHGNLVSNVLASLARIDIHPADKMLAFLPMSHVFQRMVTFIGLHAGCSALFNDSLRAFLPNLVAFRPTIMVLVPRVLEMIRERIENGVRSKTGLSGTIAGWALQVAGQVGRGYAAGQSPSGWLRFQQKLAEERVFQAIREQIGFDQLRWVVSGGAALPPELGQWWYGLGVKVVQGYGLTETSPVISVNDATDSVRFDTIGRPIEGVEVQIAADGELLSRGPHIMAGYYELPEETAQAIDADGWFHTGDIGAWEPDGHLKITDRKKNILVLANGKNVAPQPIESKLQESPYIAQAMLLGDDQSAITALLVPNYEALRAALAAQGEAVGDEADRSFVKLPAAEKLVKAEVERLSVDLADFEKVRKFALLEQEFSLEAGEVTPTLKLRRKQIRENHAAAIAALTE